METTAQLQQVVEQQLEIMEGLPRFNFTFDKQKWKNYNLIEKNQKIIIDQNLHPKSPVIKFTSFRWRI